MEEFSIILNNFKNSKVLVVGDLMIDEYVMGEVDRISPEAPIPILDVKRVSLVPGGAANTAYNVKSLGKDVLLAGVIGQDEKGQSLRELLGERGINTEGLVVDPGRRTTLKTRAMAKNQQIVRIDFEDREPINAGIEQKLLDFIGTKIGEVNAVIISDYAKGVVMPSLARGIIDLCRRNKVLSVVDPKGEDYSKYRGCNIITPNKKELANALNIPFEHLVSEGRFLQAGKMLLTHVMSDNVLVKCGAEGMILFEKSGDVFRFPAVNNQAIDVSGAGDTAVGVVTLASVSGANIREAMVIASHACGIGVGKIGTAIVLPEELEKSLKSYEGKQV